SLRSRPIHTTVDHTGTYVLTAYNDPSGVSVHRVNADGTVGEEVQQAAAPKCGIFAHQVRVTPANDAAIVVCRGNDAAKGKPEDPGSLVELTFKDGQLANRTIVAPNGGYGFGPRHLDFHPTLPLVYVSRERENKLNVYRFANGVLDAQLIFEGYARGARQHHLAPVRVHASFPSQWPHPLSGQSRLRHRESRRQGHLSR